MELAELDVTLHYKFSDRWGGYLVLSGVNYSGGFLDGTIESFHDLTGFDSGGRPNVHRNDVDDSSRTSSRPTSHSSTRRRTADCSIRRSASGIRATGR